MVAPLSQRARRELGETGGTQRPVPDGIEGSCTKNRGTTDLIGRCGEGPYGSVPQSKGVGRARLWPRVGRDRLWSPAH